MKRSYITLLSILLVVILSISGLFLLKEKNNDQSEEETLAGVLEDNPDKTITYGNGDFVYIPSDDKVGYDSKKKIYFYKSLLNIYLASEISDNQAEELAEIVDGTVVGKIQGAINMLQLQVAESSIDELDQLANRFESNNLVEFARSSIPSSITDLKELELADSEGIDPDWWTEAIHAPEAWEYLDHHKTEFKEVKVGVLESGRLGEGKREIHDKDIESSISKISNALGDDFYDEDGKINNHPRWVTKFIVADQKEEPMDFRGVAHDIADIHFMAMGSDINKERLTWEFWKVPEPYVFSFIQSTLSDGVKIINNSWGDALLSEKAWKEDSDKTEETYGDYKVAHQNSVDEVSAQLIVAFDKLLSDSSNLKNRDFLIIQAAGNGQSRFKHKTDKKKNEVRSAKTATKAIYTGFFTNINDKTYKKASDLAGGQLETRLDEMLNHTIIVGGAEQTKDKNVYQTPEWFSYGSPIDIVAPAADLVVGDEVINGTSFATPMVSGAAALVWSYHPDLEAKEVKELLLDAGINSVVWKENSTKGPYRMLNMTAFLDEKSHHASLTETYLNEYPYYNKLLETYRTAVSEQWEQNKLDKKELGPLHYEPQPLSKDYGYELKDINGDGLPELILGSYREDGKDEINEIYTLQSKKPVKVFKSAIRTNVHMYKDGTIETCSSIQAGSMIQCMLYQLNPDGKKDWKAGYEGALGQDSSHRGIPDPEAHSGKAVPEEKLKEIRKKYNGNKIIEHSFTPFILEKEKTDERSTELSNNEIEDIVKKSYRELEVPLGEVYLDDLFNQYHDIADGQKIWESGVNPNDPFYKQVYKLLYPKVKDMAAEEGMESLINEAYSLYWQPPAPGSFYGPSYDLEVLDKDGTHFKVKQTKKIGPQDVGGVAYNLIYVIDYVKEDGKWKFAGFEKEK